MDDMIFFDGTLDRRAVKMNLANEGFEARKKDEEVAAKKRKAEDDARWEGEQPSSLVHESPAAIARLFQQRLGNSVWIVGAASRIRRKRKRSRKQMFLADDDEYPSSITVSTVKHRLLVFVLHTPG